MYPINEQEFNALVEELSIMDLSGATIRQINSLAHALEDQVGEPVVHLELGNPGLPAETDGVEAEIEALRCGVANQYPPIFGVPRLKKAGKAFLKRFLGIDVSEKCIVPTVGSMQGSFTLQIILAQRLKDQKDTMLFLMPGFPANPQQAKVLGIKHEQFDIYNYRGKALEAKLEEYLKKGNVTALMYSNPNNPAWTNLTEEELEIIGRLATKYDVIVLEDMAYFGMDFRENVQEPGKTGVTVAHYTDNYILLMSGSKMFSYAGQRIALVCMSDKVYDRKYEYLEKFYEMPKLGEAYINGVLYVSSSGTSHSAQYALAAMLEKAASGELKFVDHTSEYARRAEIMKGLFLENGFHIVYERDGDRPISDGFFFTVGYNDMTGAELQRDLMRYGISAITLDSTGSDQQGIRVCVSMVSTPDDFKRLEERLKAFAKDHPTHKNTK